MQNQRPYRNSEKLFEKINGVIFCINLSKSLFAETEIKCLGDKFFDKYSTSDLI